MEAILIFHLITLKSESSLHRQALYIALKSIMKQFSRQLRARLKFSRSFVRSCFSVVKLFKYNRHADKNCRYLFRERNHMETRPLSKRTFLVRALFFGPSSPALN